jgi:hypothetical protein
MEPHRELQLVIESNDSAAILKYCETKEFGYYVGPLIQAEKYDILQSIFQRFVHGKTNGTLTTGELIEINNAIITIGHSGPRILQLFLKSGLKFDSFVNPFIDYLVRYNASIYNWNQPIDLGLTEILITIFELLIEYGYDLHQNNDAVLLYCKDISILRYLINHGMNIGPFQEMLFAKSIQENNRTMAKFFLEHGVNPNISTETIRTAIILASGHFRFKMINLLVDYGYDLRSNNDEIMRKIGTDYDHRTNYDHRTKHELIWALSDKTTLNDFIKLFIEAGCNIKDNGTQLMTIAIKCKLWKEIDLLIGNGFDLKQLETKVSSLSDTNTYRTLQVFIDHGLSLNTASKILEHT